MLEGFIEKYNLSNKKIGVGVSGGVDSMTLLTLLLSSVKKENLTVIHIEHGIRKQTSMRDCDFVVSFCKKHNVAIEVFHADIPTLCEQSKRSEETEARLFRRAVFDKLVSEKKVDYVALAHNKNDAKESVLMHIFRGCGINGLVSMSECDGYILRPLLFTLRSEIENYAKENGVEFMHDETNDNVDYDRNYVRKVIIPAIEKRYDTDSLIRLSQNAKEYEDYLNSQLCENEIMQIDGTVALPLRLLTFDALGSAYVMSALKKVGLNCDVESKHIAQIKELGTKENGAKINLPHSFCVAKEYEQITFYKEEEESVEEEEFAFGLTPFLDGIISVNYTDEQPQSGKQIFDADKIPYDAVFRLRRDGDVFKPYKSGTKKLKEYFIDKKIPQRLRGKIPLLCSGNEVLIVGGIEVSDNVKITEKTLQKAEFIYEKD